MIRILKMTLLVALVSMVFSATAFAGSTKWELPCRKGRTGEEIGKVVREATFMGEINMSVSELVQECHDKYPLDCDGECWLCQDKRGADVIFNTCWGPNGECVGADCNAWK